MHSEICDGSFHNFFDYSSPKEGHQEQGDIPLGQFPSGWALIGCEKMGMFHWSQWLSYSVHFIFCSILGAIAYSHC